jgi:hypothetical protein
MAASVTWNTARPNRQTTPGAETRESERRSRHLRAEDPAASGVIAKGAVRESRSSGESLSYGDHCLMGIIVFGRRLWKSS